MSNPFDRGRPRTGSLEDGGPEFFGELLGGAAFFLEVDVLPLESSVDWDGVQILGRTAVSPQWGQNALRSVVLTSNRVPQRLQSMFTAAALCLDWHSYAMKRSSTARVARPDMTG